MATVFISSKSEDYPTARKVYECLTTAGIDCFFSDVSLQRIGRSEYKAEIDRQLDLAVHLVLVTSSAIHAESTWVKYEWNSFDGEKLSGRKTGNIVTVLCKGMTVRDLPYALRRHESFAFSGQLTKLAHYLRRGAQATVRSCSSNQNQTQFRNWDVSIKAALPDAAYGLAVPPNSELQGYHVESLLNKDGFGLTYLATDPVTQLKVTIKELLPDGIATRVGATRVAAVSKERIGDWEWALRRFEDEARILSQLHHPNIIRVLRFVRGNGTAYMVMEYVEGRNLAECLKAQRRPEETLLRNLLIALLDGLDCVHQKQVLHRDICPESIIIATRGKPMLHNFISARHFQGITMDLTATVRHGYSPFEQYQTKGHQGPYTDIYALAAVIAHAMTGEKPPPATDRIVDDSLFAPLVLQCKGQYSERFCHALDIALRVRPADRPQTVDEFRTLLGEVPKPPEKRRKWPWL